MRILNSYLRIIHFICVTTTLLTCFVRGSLAEDASRSQKLLTAQQTGSQVWPLVGTAVQTPNKPLVRLTFVDTATGKEFKQSIQPKLLKGTQEIAGGYYDLGSETAVIFAYIKKITNLQILKIGFRPQGKVSRIASFAIQPVTSDAAVAAHGAYRRLGAADGRKIKSRKPFFRWPPRPRRPRCNRRPPLCIPTPPVDPSPVPPPPSPPGGPAPQPPTDTPCPTCKTIKLLCGSEPQANRQQMTKFALHTTPFMASNVSSSDWPCQGSMFVRRDLPSDKCSICLGIGVWKIAVSKSNLCNQEMSIEEFQKRNAALRESLILAPIPDQFKPKKGQELLEAIIVKSFDLAENCIMADEISHLLRQKWCENHLSCDEWQSTAANAACWQDPRFIALQEELIKILEDDRRFPSAADKQRRDEYLNEMKAMICSGYARGPVAQQLEECICCASKDDYQVSINECLNCVEMACTKSNLKKISEKVQTSAPTFCKSIDSSPHILALCEQYISGTPQDGSRNHNCAAMILSNQMNSPRTASGTISTVPNKVVDREPNCSPVPPESEAAPLPPGYSLYECPSGPGVAPSEGDSDTWTSKCQTKNSSGELVDAPQYECERKWDGDTWILSKPCSLT